MASDVISKKKRNVYELLCLEDLLSYASTIASIVLGAGSEGDTRVPMSKYLVTSYSLQYNPISYPQVCIQPFVWFDVSLSIAKVEGEITVSEKMYFTHPQRHWGIQRMHFLWAA